MKVIWKGSIELQSGQEKITLEAPEGTEDDVHMLKMAAKRGEELELSVKAKDIPAYEFDTILPVCRMIQSMVDESFQSGIEKGKDSQQPEHPEGFKEEKKDSFMVKAFAASDRSIDPLPVKTAQEMVDNRPNMQSLKTLNNDGLD